MPDHSSPPPRARRRGEPVSAEEELRRAQEREARDRASHGRRAARAPDRIPVAEPAPAGPSEVVDEPIPVPPPSPFRVELQGLRAVAVLMVVCYHVWFGRVSGGVDIFLLISAFLMTGAFMRRIESGAPLRIARYWVHTFSRLVPTSALMILLILVASLTILPATRWLDLLEECIASVTFTENWLLLARSVDYETADHAAASPLQHFWSLSIQGQVFLLWPLVIGAFALLARRTGRSPRATLLTVFGLITAVSLAWSVHETASSQATAYFDTAARLWEFSLGSLLALLLPVLERRVGYRQSDDPAQGRARAARAVCGWAGIMLVLACGWIVDVQGVFPGWIALWPLLAASAVIAAGSTGLSWGADRLLASAPLQWLGRISYALYLVHWPLLVLSLSAFGVRRPGALQGALLILAAVLLAWLITVRVDRPLRRSSWLEARWWRGALAIGLACGLVIGASGILGGSLASRAARATSRPVALHPGAEALVDGSAAARVPVADPVPDASAVSSDWVSLPHACRGRLEVPPELADSCSTDESGDSQRPVLVVVGDSRARQYAGALQQVAHEHGWTSVLIWAPGCPLAIGDFLGQPCQQHNDAVEDYLIRSRPAVVALEATQLPWSGEEREMQGAGDYASRLMASGIDVIGLRDMPRLASDPADCIGAAIVSRSCDLSLAAAYQPTAPPLSIPTPPAGSAGRYVPLDLTGQICPQDRCRPVIGNVYVWLDERHITATYSRSLAGTVTRELDARGWSWQR